MTSTPPNAEAAESAIRQIGAEFRRLRGLRGERIEDISAYLNIKSTHIFGVEQGDLSVIASKREAKSVVRRYADYLGLDGEGIAGPMDPIIGSLQGDKAPPKPQPALRFDRTSAILLACSVVLGVVIGWSSIGDVSQFDLLTPPVNAGIVGSAEPEATPLEEEADHDAAALATDQTRSLNAVNERDDDQPITDVAEGLSGEAAEASDALLAELKTAIAAEEDAAKLENPANVLAAIFAERGDGAHIYEAENTDARVIVRALSDVSVQVASRSRDYVWTQTMKPREMLMVPNRNDLELWSGDAAGIELLLDGAILPTLGPPGTVVSGLSLAVASLEGLVDRASAIGGTNAETSTSQ
jgi:cytoskeleton protein RodZ